MPEACTIAVAMSGGVDSSTVAAMLRLALAVPVAGAGLAGHAGAPPAFGGDQDRGESRSRERHAVMVKRSEPAGHTGVVM